MKKTEKTLQGKIAGASTLLLKQKRILVIFIVATIGMSLLLFTYASTSAVSVEPEQGSLSSPDMALSDGTASRGQAVRFGAASQPPLGSFPTIASTGPKPGIELKKSGSITVTEPGTIVENLDITGVIAVRVSNVTIRNVRVKSGTNYYSVKITDGLRNITIEDSELHFSTETVTTSAATYGGSAITIRNSYIHGSGDGIKAMSDSLYEGNYIYVTRIPGSDKHVDGIQGSGRTNYTIRNNTIIAPNTPEGGGANNAVFVHEWNGKAEYPVSNVIIEGNYLDGGVYTTNIVGTDPAAPTIVRNNTYGPNFQTGRRNGRDVSPRSGIRLDHVIYENNTDIPRIL